MGHLQRTEELTNKFKRFLDFDPQAKKRKNKKQNTTSLTGQYFSFWNTICIFRGIY